MVQWGHGLVPAVPFFEAFPTGTFIRGEGGTIAAAELDAFRQYATDQACAHQWGRTRLHANGGLTVYANGAGWCRKCGAYRSQMFPAIQTLGWWRKPLSLWEADHYHLIVDRDASSDEIDRRLDAMSKDAGKSRRQHKRVLRLRHKLYGVESAA